MAVPERRLPDPLPATTMVLPAPEAVMHPTVPLPEAAITRAAVLPPAPEVAILRAVPLPEATATTVAVLPPEAVIRPAALRPEAAATTAEAPLPEVATADHPHLAAVIAVLPPTAADLLTVAAAPLAAAEVTDNATS